MLLLGDTSEIGKVSPEYLKRLTVNGCYNYGVLLTDEEEAQPEPTEPSD
jgi:hypothetical protein